MTNPLLELAKAAESLDDIADVVAVVQRMTDELEGEVLAQLAELDGLVPDDLGVALYRLAGEVDPALAVVELGSYKGKSTCYLAAGGLLGRGAHVWAFDAWDLDGNIAGRHGYDTARVTFDAQVASLGLEARVTVEQSFTAEAGRRWAGPPVGMLYVDADHEYEGVWDDFWSWWPHLPDGAVVAFDDYDTPRNPGVKRAVDRIARAGHLRDLNVTAERLAVATLRR